MLFSEPREEGEITVAQLNQAALLSPRDFFAAFMQHEGPHDRLLESYLPMDANGVSKPDFKAPPKPKEGTKGNRCYACHDPNAEAKQDGLCASCGVDRLRIRSRRMLKGAAQPTDESCMVCQEPAGLGLSLEQMEQMKKGGDGGSAGILKTISAIRHPESTVVCVGCAAMFLTPISRPHKLKSLIWAPTHGVFLTRQELPWWQITWRPALVFTARDKGGEVHRVAYAEVSVDPDLVCVNVIADKQSPKPTPFWLPALTPQEVVALEGSLQKARETVETALSHDRSWAKKSKKAKADAVRLELRAPIEQIAEDVRGLDDQNIREARREMRDFIQPSVG